MLEGYYDLDGERGTNVATNRKRLLAMQAALEIAKASAGAAAGQANDSKLKFDLRHATEAIESLADAIQKALDK
ncbi:MAG: hypothetical protein FT726_15265 [Pantoea sp. Morm]|uniref:hypothetical protein n=1 Tax=Pantoea sp. Morm TaxID=2601250 RepID=UPI001D60C0C1|nr:hypothetical protein [Pantoea sp. Morm]